MFPIETHDLQKEQNVCKPRKALYSLFKFICVLFEISVEQLEKLPQDRFLTPRLSGETPESHRL